VVIDITISDEYHDERFEGWIHNLHDAEPGVEETAPTAIPPLDISDYGGGSKASYNEESFLICRGHMPAYLLSSGVHAVGILVSRLQPPSWGKDVSERPSAASLPDISHWNTLVRGFLTDGKASEAKYQRRTIRGSGLVLLLQGPKRITKIVAQRKNNPLESHTPLPRSSINQSHIVT
jgi:hypothetical protein